jgi:class 3 adenylate cyclase
LQASCVPGRVLVSQSVWELVGAEIACQPMGQMQLKGISTPVMTYAIVETTPFAS